MTSNRDIWVNRCRRKLHSRFSLAQMAVLRWEQLLRGARPRIPTENPRWMETPLREIANDAVALDFEEFQVKLQGSPFEPPRPEPEEELDEIEELMAEKADGAPAAEETADDVLAAAAEIAAQAAAPEAAEAKDAPAPEAEPKVEASADAPTESEAESKAEAEPKKPTGNGGSETQTGDAA
jgi:hypothetical protein